jgi:hypothetical protein
MTNIRPRWHWGKAERDDYRTSSPKCRVGTAFRLFIRNKFGGVLARFRRGSGTVHGWFGALRQLSASGPLPDPPS